jgi:hypothetical protein
VGNAAALLADPSEAFCLIKPGVDFADDRLARRQATREKRPQKCVTVDASAPPGIGAAAAAVPRCRSRRRSSSAGAA